MFDIIKITIVYLEQRGALHTRSIEEGALIKG